MSEIISGIDYSRIKDALAEKLREELVGAPLCPSDITLYSDEMLDTLYHYYGEKVSPYWTTSGFNGQGKVDEVMARRPVRYGYIMWRLIKMPDFVTPALDDSSWLCTCLRNGGGNPSPSDITTMCYYKKSVTHKFRNRTRSSGIGSLDTDLTSYLPSDYLTGSHTYMLKHNAWGIEIYIDGSLVFLLVFGTPATTISSGPPYAVSTYPIPLQPYLYPFIFFSPTKNGVTVPFDFPTPRYNLTWSDGDPYPPRCFRLYVTGTTTLLAGYSISSGSVMSHPFPVRYESKTIYFMANQSGTLEIDIYTSSGNWRAYDSGTVSANTLWRYKMTGDAFLARLTFTPLTYPCTISEAEVVLNG